MATNEILPFASTDTGTNLLSQSAYSSDSQRLIGNQPGLGRAKLVNKALRQSSLISAGLAEFLADNQSNNITDGLTTQNISDYMTLAVQQAAGLNNIATPPQFDNDTSIATTEFVQRALGNFRSIATYSLNTNLSSSDIGKLVAPLGNSITFNLPLASASAAGSRIVFYGNDYNNTVISGNGNNIAYGALGSVASISLGATDTLEVFNVGGTWYAIGGTAYLMASTAFTASFGSRYQKLPTGLILQWGSSTAISAGSQLTITLPVAMTGSYVVVAISESESSNTTPITAAWSVVSSTQFVLRNKSTNVSAFSWIALGY